MKKHLIKLLFLMLVFIFAVQANASDGGNYEDPGWEMSERMDRFFYSIHGTSVWGHEFGFFKSPENCSIDTLWVTFSSHEDEIDNFKGKKIDFDLIVDGKKHRVSLEMLNPFTIGLTNVLTFTNFTLEDAVMSALINGEHLYLEVVGPKEAMDFFDIKKDEFSLANFIPVRTEATNACRKKSRRVHDGGWDIAWLNRKGGHAYEK